MLHRLAPMRRTTSAASKVLSASLDSGTRLSPFDAIFESASIDRTGEIDLSSAGGADGLGHCPDSISGMS